MMIFWAAITCAGSALASDIKIGMSAPFSGPSRVLGIELYRGAWAYFKSVNQLGGVHGRQIRLIAYDDAYDPAKAVQNTIKLINEDEVILLFSFVGTPTVTRVLPLLKQYKDENIFLFFPFTGAEPQRQPPYSEFVFNLRASYFDETRGLVEQFVDVGRTRIALFYQADAYGRNGWEGARRALREQGLDIAGEATYARGGTFEQSYSEQVRLLQAASPDAIISVCSYAACAGFVRDIRATGWDIPIANLSFVASEAMAELLEPLFDVENEAGLGNLIQAQVAPSYLDTSLPAVAEYRQLMDQLESDLPDGLVSEEYETLDYSFVSLEGFLNAKLLVRILEELGPELEQSALNSAVEAMGSVDLGTGHPVSLGEESHQSSDHVYYTVLENGQFVPFDDWQRLAKPSQ